jgi:hypothetical protein
MNYLNCITMAHVFCVFRRRELMVPTTEQQEQLAYVQKMETASSIAAVESERDTYRFKKGLNYFDQ